ncbi:MAG: hypothetical protein K2R98_26175 [Gemmataceae bacterium]|nr:hypothetical protein [Gemmataceae bacterium]
MKRWFRPTLPLVALAGLIVHPSAPGADVDPRAKKAIEALEKVLPDVEKAADECAKAISAFEGSGDVNVRAATDAARLRIDCARSVRAIIAKEPNYLIYHVNPARVIGWKESFEYFLGCARSKTDPYRGMTSGVRALRSPVDGQLLFYVFRLPKDYDPAKRYPLEVALHSGAGLTWKADWVDGKPSSDSARAEKEQRIWISPCGRGNNSYAGMGEVAVMDAIRDAQHHYAVDANRIFIGGASMGGSGGFRLAALHPDVFAAAHSLTGGADYGVPAGDGRFDAYLLSDNFCNTGMCIWDAPKEGHYVKNHAFADALRARATKYAGSYPNIELTDPNGSHGIIDRKLQAEGGEWLRKQVRNPWPKRVVYKTYSLRYDGAYWAHIDTVEKSDAPARIEAAHDAGKLRVAVENADRFHLNLDKELVGETRELEVSVNGGPSVRASTGRAVYFEKAAGKWAVAEKRYPPGLVKKHGLSGPVQDVFMGGPVLMVHGTREKRDVAAEKVVSDAVLRWFGPEDGGATLHTSFDRKADGDVTAADIADKHLVLFGTPAQNELVRKVAPRLPVKFLADGVEVAGKAHRGKGVGLVMVYPNPLNPERYILLVPEDYAGDSPMTFPDYLVVKNVGSRQDVLDRGYFDARWQISTKK